MARTLIALAIAIVAAFHVATAGAAAFQGETPFIEFTETVEVTASDDGADAIGKQTATGLAHAPTQCHDHCSWFASLGAPDAFARDRCHMAESTEKFASTNPSLIVPPPNGSSRSEPGRK